MNSDNLALLGLREGATPLEVRAAYIVAVKRHHPDLARGELDRRRRTGETAAINMAYAALLNPPARRSPNVPNEQRVPTPPREWGPPTHEREPRSPGSQTNVYDGLGVALGPTINTRNPLPWLGLIGAAVAAGLVASSVAGNPILCVGVMVVGVIVGRWPKVEVAR